MIDKIITLKNGKEYVIIDKCSCNNEVYYFACELLNEEPDENFKILQIYEKNNKKVMKLIKDNEIIKKVCSILDK